METIMETIFEIKNLTKIYKDFWGRAKHTAVSDVTLQLRKGEVLGLIGPNGAGKTTTIKILLGLLKPSSGRVTIFGEEPKSLAVKARLGFLPEESYLYKFLTPHETLMFFGRLFSLSKKQLTERIDKLLKDVGLDHVAHVPVKEFSKGMTRRLGLAQAMINDPELLLLDEPTSGLDPLGTEEVKQLIVRQKKDGKSVLVCSHLLSDMESVCDRIAMLIHGKLVLYDTVDKLLKVQGETILRFKDTEKTKGVNWQEVLHQQGVEGLTVDHPHKSLEQLFLDTVESSK
jgi:ABC-2 type transport system ATP-binding protein